MKWASLGDIVKNICLAKSVHKVRLKTACSQLSKCNNVNEKTVAMIAKL